MEARTVSAGGPHPYTLSVGLNIEEELLAAVKQEGANRRIAVITDSTGRSLWGKQIVSVLKKTGLPVELFSFPRGEKNKNQKNVTALQHALLRKHYGRDTLIVAVGGGVVGDLVGFVAATYVRGVPYIHVPTTLLAMVDSSIGGKVGIDTPYGKNMVGLFQLPRAVVMDLQYLATLPRKEVINGLLEAVKTFFTSDESALSLVEALDLQEPLKTPETLQEVIYRSMRIKTGVTDRDVREGNERQILNFGHTIGHALELISKYALPHGYAVGYGMLAEAKISERLGILPADDCAALYKKLARLGISAKDFPRFPITKILTAIKGDKKVRAGVPHYVLLESIGSVYKKDGKYAHPVEEKVVKDALESVTREK